MSSTTNVTLVFVLGLLIVSGYGAGAGGKYLLSLSEAIALAKARSPRLLCPKRASAGCQSYALKV